LFTRQARRGEQAGDRRGVQQQLVCFAVSPKVFSFGLPLGYSFNPSGSMMYCIFAVVFIAQAYDIDFLLGRQATMLLLLMVTSSWCCWAWSGALVPDVATRSATVQERGT
jgi:hypothetical protein